LVKMNEIFNNKKKVRQDVCQAGVTLIRKHRDCAEILRLINLYKQSKLFQRIEEPN
jgi:hypothetical protein